MKVKEEFKKKRESWEDWWWITFDDIAKCAIEWWISSQPYTRDMQEIVYLVLLEAGVEDAEDSDIRVI